MSLYSEARLTLTSVGLTVRGLLVVSLGTALIVTTLSSLQKKSSAVIPIFKTCPCIAFCLPSPRQAGRLLSVQVFRCDRGRQRYFLNSGNGLRSA